jgi:CheY-like chemotaxis protein
VLLVEDETDASEFIGDLGMPQKDGYEFIRDVRKQGLRPRRWPSAHTFGQKTAFRSAQTGYQTHLAKLVEPAELLAVIASLAGRFERRAED